MGVMFVSASPHSLFLLEELIEPVVNADTLGVPGMGIQRLHVVVRKPKRVRVFGQSSLGAGSLPIVHVVRKRIYTSRSMDDAFRGIQLPLGTTFSHRCRGQLEGLDEVDPRRDVTWVCLFVFSPFRLVCYLSPPHLFLSHLLIAIHKVNGGSYPTSVSNPKKSYHGTTE